MGTKCGACGGAIDANGHCDPGCYTGGGRHEPKENSAHKLLERAADWLCSNPLERDQKVLDQLYLDIQQELGQGMRRKTLEILEGLKYRGKIHVIGKKGEAYLVDFDAVDPRGVEEHAVMDRALLTAKELKGWTGWPSPEDEPRTGDKNE